MDGPPIFFKLVIFVVTVYSTDTLLLKEGLHWTSDNNIIFIQNGTTDWITKDSVPNTWHQSVGNSNRRYIGMSYDYRKNYIVMSDRSTKSINVVGKDIDGSFKNAYLHVGTSSRVGHVTVDWLSGNVYWADSVFGWIGLQAIPSNIRTIVINDTFKVVVEKYLDIPSGIAVHPQERFLFWSDIGAPAKIERSDLDGSSRNALIWLGIVRPISLTVDHSKYILYWVDSVRSTIESCDFHGNNRKVLATIFTSQFYGLAIYQNYVLVSDQAKREIAVYSTKGDPVPNATTTANIPYSMVIFTDDNQPMASEPCRTKACEHICLTTATGAKCTCYDGYKLNEDGLRCTVDEHTLDKHFLINNGTRVCVYPITSINSHPYLRREPNCGVASNDLQEINFIAVDSSRELFFTASKKSRFIYQQKLSDVPHRIFEGSNNISGLSYDWTTSELYWTEKTGENIYSSVIETNSHFIITNYRRIFDSNLVSPRSITLDPLQRRIFWIAGSHYFVIQTARLDQNQISIMTLVQSGLSSPFTLTFSRKINRLFWTDVGKIGRVSPNGTDTHINYVSTSFSYSGITTYKNYVLWLSKNSSGVYMAVEDLSDITAPEREEFKLTDVTLATELHIFDSSEQPQIQEPCVVDNGGCEHICIVEDFVSHCECELGYILHSDRKSCISELFKNNFFLTLDELSNRIYQIDKISGNISTLNIDYSYIPSAVTFDNITQKVIWCDNKCLQVKIANLNGSEEQTLTSTISVPLCTEEAFRTILFSKRTCSPGGKNSLTCNITCDSGYIFNDGKQTQTYHCTSYPSISWTPRSSPNDCLPYTEKAYGIEIEVTYSIIGSLAYKCLTQHNAQLRSTKFRNILAERLKNLCSSILITDNIKVEDTVITTAIGFTMISKLMSVIPGGNLLDNTTFCVHTMAFQIQLGSLNNELGYDSKLNCSGNTDTFAKINSAKLTNIRIVCRLGSIQLSTYLGRKCVACPRGSYFFNDSCEECPARQYQDDVGQLQCKACNGQVTTDELTCIDRNQQSRVAVDYQTGSIYFTSGNAISVISQDGKFRWIVVERFQNVVSIALHSKMSKIFWIEMGSLPRIQSSNMDGTSITTLLSFDWRKTRSTKDLAIDISDNALIWCDDELDKIGRIDLTTYKTTALRYNSKDYPVAVSVENQYVYFISNRKRSIMRINKNDGKDAQVVVSSVLYGKLASLYISQSLVSESRCLDNILNGDIDPKCGRRHNDSCSFKCNDGYKTNGNRLRLQCRADGNWDTDVNEICIGLGSTDGLSTGQVTGIAVGLLVAILIIFVVVVCLIKRIRRGRKDGNPSQKTLADPTMLTKECPESQGVDTHYYSSPNDHVYYELDNLPRDEKQGQNY